MKQYYWAEGLDDYSSDNELPEYDKVIEIKRLNFFIGKNNAGKSRFLRNLFISDNESSQFQPAELTDERLLLLTNLSHLRNNKQLYSFTFPDSLNIKLIDDFYERLESDLKSINFTQMRKSEFKKTLFQYYQAMYQRINSSTSLFKMNFIDTLNNNLENYNFNAHKNLFKNNFYIPILRGLRGLDLEKNENNTPLSKRTCKDYFKNKEYNLEYGLVNKTKTSPASLYQLENKKLLVTGESFFEELMTCLLGEPEQRDLIQNYQERLSNYFFENKLITLIPKYKEDVIHIKIGDDKQLPIYELGDGLQQAIILTYEAFIKKDEIHAFFIEEPELHMHPGMLRQLMNFYLNETPHYYFFTTHSNHLLDMVDESNEVIIQKFTKKPDGKFQINRCDKDRDLLATLGVKPSSIYLANCTIWVEGITDRLYIAKYMQKYLEELEANGSDLYTKYRRFMPNYHYAFVEYTGGNIAHWSFDNVAADQEVDRGLTAKCIASDMLLIADGDNKGKADRVKTLAEELGDKSFHIFECKEIENTLPANIIIATAKDKFSRMKTNTTDGFDISVLDTNVTQPDFNHVTDGIGRILDDAIWPAGSARTKSCFGESSGTIKDKLGFCRLALSMMERESWQLTDSAKALCEKIFQHIESCNKT